jgi:Lrp/AsnC family transcriptional regulator, regulator for asnA, asnC and gidA
MDKTDIILCQLLLSNSRLSYRELAEKLNLSVTAIHSRIQSLIEMDIIRKFTTRISIFAKKAIPILIIGSSKTNSIKNVKQKIELHNRIYWLAVGGGNVLIIGAYLENISEMEGVVRFVKENAEMPDPTVGITVSPIPIIKQNVNSEIGFCELDYKIVRSMKDDSRKAVSAVAEELGVSTKTVRRRLSRMIKNFLVEFSIDWYPDASNDIISIFDVQFKNDANPNSANLILQKYYPNTLFYWGLSNIPNNYIFMVWTPTSKELKTIRENLEQEPTINTVVANIIYTGYIFKSWRDEIP